MTKVGEPDQEQNGVIIKKDQSELDLLIHQLQVVRNLMGEVNKNRAELMRHNQFTELQFALNDLREMLPDTAIVQKVTAQWLRRGIAGFRAQFVNPYVFGNSNPRILRERTAEFILMNEKSIRVFLRRKILGEQFASLFDEFMKVLQILLKTAIRQNQEAEAELLEALMDSSREKIAREKLVHATEEEQYWYNFVEELMSAMIRGEL